MSRRGLTARQLVEGMALGFDPSAAGEVPIVVELALTGEEAGTYQLVGRGGGCRFEVGASELPTLRIRGDAEVWRAVVEHRLDARTAVLDGRLEVNGDLGLFQRLPRVFRPVSAAELRAPAHQRAPGPVRLPAMAWLVLALVPWKLFWIVTAGRGPRPAVLVGLAAAVALLVAREASGGATFFERATAAVFAAGASATLAVGAFPARGAVAGSLLALAAIWAASIVHAGLPLTAEYSRWSYVPRLWGTALFRYPNGFLTLFWSAVFAAMAALAAAVSRGALRPAVATAASIAIGVAGGVFTRRHERGARDRRVDDLDGALARLRSAARVMLVVVGVGFLLVEGPGAIPAWALVPAAACVALAAWVPGSRVRPAAARDIPAEPPAP